ncbi:transcription factor 25 [Macrosteles quadrilineatus]|uniref:transcription factor 25 n=1 Tax=Macrosteles quadrilineatus TaxID=74068 RepID=UPI0023E256BE|nr:transcription factor 25 [Macrosteles quadrilineatus]
MSSRVLRKLGLGEKDITSIADEASDTEADFSSSGGAKKKQLNINRYDLLNQQSHSESEVKEDDDHETAGSLNAQENAADCKDAARRKKKKKRKKHGKVPSNARSSEDNIEDEVERSVREVNKLLGDSAQVEPGREVATANTSGCKNRILNIEHRHLNHNNELKKIFGSKIVQNEQSKRRGGSRTRGVLKTTWLVSLKDNWPPIVKTGLSMSLVKTENGISTFTYEHSLNYQQVQMKFLDAVESLNPDNIVAIINSSPYHVDALLQLSELCRLSEDLSMAAELIERALYCLECAFHPSFNLVTGTCRLDYRKQENRALYLAVFKHLTFVGARACYRTALEFCKLLLSLDPDNDPLGIVLAIDFYALRAQKYNWLIRFASDWEPTRNLSQLPNFAFSIAVAHFQLGQDVELAHHLLQNALIMFPGVLLPLLSKCGVQPDSRVGTHTFFTTAEINQSASLKVLVQLYVARCYHVWKESELLPWLERNVHAVLDRVDKQDSYVADCEVKRAKRYPKLPRNIHRHIVLSDYKDVTFSELSQSPVLSFDPLPPVDSINLYNRPPRLLYHDNGNAFSVFLRSFMPNFNVNAPASDGDEVEGGEGAAVDLRRSMTSLLDAMRDLLSNIHMPDGPAEGDIDSDEERP